jgi:hypothetical protein
MTDSDVMNGNQIVLSRIALLEQRLHSLAERVLAGLDTDESATDGIPLNLVIEPDSQLELASGFYLREWDGDGTPFRWAGRADHFEFRFFLDRRSARPFKMSGIFAPGITADLSGFVDYRPIPMKTQRGEGMAEIVGRIPADPLTTGVTLTFVCPSVRSPTAQDTRRLSFAFTKLAVGDPCIVSSSAALRRQQG